MIHLLLDTNIWLYIANNYRKINKDAHIKLFDTIKKFQLNGNIVIYTNDIILEEWQRNKKVQKEYVDDLRTILEKKTELKSLESIIGKTDALQKVKKEFSDIVDYRIKQNERHILDVENFMNSCPNIPVKDEHKLKTIDLAISKKVPFHNSKNNVNDTLILLSFDDYVKELLITVFDDCYFVSHNKKEYCSADINDFHPDLKKELLSEIKFGDYDALWNILDLSEELRKELDKQIDVWLENIDNAPEIYSHNDYDYEEEYGEEFTCEDCNGYNEIDEDTTLPLNKIAVEFLSLEAYKLQYNLLFPDKKLSPLGRKPTTTFITKCNVCEIEHILCPICGITISCEYEFCPSCRVTFELSERQNSRLLMVDDVNKHPVVDEI